MAVKVTETLEREYDKETGEILSVRKEQKVQDVYYNTEPEYIKIYIHTVSFLHGLIGKQDKILFEIAKTMSYAGDDEGQVVTLTKYVKNKIAQNVGCTLQYVSDTVSDLCKKQLLIKIGKPKERTCAYQVNPKYIAKGHWKDIKELQLIFSKKTFENKEIGIITKTKNEEILIQSFKNELKKTEPHPDQIPLIENEKSCPHCDEKLKLKKDKSEYYCPNFFSKDEQKKCKGHTEKNIYFGDKNPNSIIEQIKKTDLESCKKLLFGYDKKTLIEIAQQVKVSIKNNDSKERIVEKIHFDLVSFGENWNAMTRGVKD